MREILHRGFGQVQNRLKPAGVAVWVALFSGAAFGQAPSFEHAFPPGVTRGVPAEVTLVKFAGPWPPSVWVSRNDVSVEPDPGRQGVIRVSTSDDAEPGIFSLRLYGPGGVSSVLRLTVELAPSVLEDEEQEKSGGKQGRMLEDLPIVVDGRLDAGGDVDRCGVFLHVSEWLIAEAVAHALGTPLDTMLHVRGPQGNVVAFQHDAAGLDPFIAWRAEREGVHVLELSGFSDPPQANIRLAGGSDCVYRLRVSRGPAVRWAEPMGVQAGGANQIRLVGWNVPETEEWIYPVDLPAEVADRTDGWVAGVPGSIFPVLFPIGRGKEILESNLAGGSAGRTLQAPVQVTGCLTVEAEQDRYGFQAAQGRAMRFGLWSVRGRFPLDGVLAVLDGEGKELASKDALGQERADPELLWTAPATGEYHLTVRDLMGRGGEEFRYRVSFDEDRPGCLVRAKSEALTLAAGSTGDWEFSSERRQGYAAVAEAVLSGMPEGIEAPATEVPAGGGDLKITLTAPPGMAPGTWPLRLDVRARESVAEGSESPFLRGESVLWLTVQAPAEPEQ